MQKTLLFEKVVRRGSRLPVLTTVVPATAVLTMTRYAFSSSSSSSSSSPYRRATATTSKAAPAPAGRRRSLKSADDFLAGLRSHTVVVDKVSQTTTAVPATSADHGARRRVTTASVEELLADEDGDDSAILGEANAASEVLFPPESVERESAFYGTPSADVARAEADGESILSHSVAEEANAPGLPSVALDADRLSMTGAAGTVSDILDNEDDLEDGEDDVFMPVAPTSSRSSAVPLPGLGGVNASSAVAGDDGGIADVFEGNSARMALEEALEDMALLEEEEATAAAAASRLSVSAAGLGVASITTSSAAPGFTPTASDVSFFGASPDDILAAKGSIESKANSANRSVGEGDKAGFDADKKVASAELESMGEELRSPAR